MNKDKLIIGAFVILIIVIIGLTIKVINSSPVIVSKPDVEREYLLNKIRQDSLDMIDIRASYIRFKEIAESKPKEIIKIKIKYVEKKDSALALHITGKQELLANYLHNQ